MSLTFQVLGLAGQDNALLVQIDTGQAVSRLLFDCGDGCLWQLAFGDVQLIDHPFFSHLPMDHVSGFDTFFRWTFNRAVKPNHVWRPPRTAEILHYHLRGFLWNLHRHREAGGPGPAPRTVAQAVARTAPTTWRRWSLTKGRKGLFLFVAPPQPTRNATSGPAH